MIAHDTLASLYYYQAVVLMLVQGQMTLCSYLIAGVFPNTFAHYMQL
jgi:hypothetical protein